MAANSSEQVFACTLLPGSASDLLIAQADQIAVDVAKQTVDLRVARTMNTAVPEDWKFGPKTAPGDQGFTVTQKGSSIVGAGVRDDAAHAFELDGGILTWTMVVMHESLNLSWRCNEARVPPAQTDRPM